MMTPPARPLLLPYTTLSDLTSEIDATTGTIDLENVIINGGILGGTSTKENTSALNSRTVIVFRLVIGTKMTAAVGTLDLTGTITNTASSEIYATTGTIDLEN